ncbi:DUF4012 domain-containing protein [Patescibacteria group bacterium]|nr:DUF4012 domain-containing protein [Patescibacteria group bacterium]
MAEDFNLVSQVDHALRVEPEAAREPSYRRPRKRGLKIAAGIVAAILLILTTTTLIGAARFISGVSETQMAIEEAKEAALEFDFVSAKSSLTKARRGLERAQSGLVFVRWALVLPWVGDQVRAVTAVVDAGVRAISAFEQAIDIVADVYQIVLEAQEILEITEPEGEELTFADFSSEVKANLLRTLHNSLPRLQESQIKLRLAQEDLDKLEDLDVSSVILEAVEPFQKLLPDLVAGIDFLVPFAATVGDLTGVDEDRQWLVLFLNNQEMRPGGGFIGNYGLLLTRDGEIKNLLVDDSYAVDVLVQFDDTYQLPPPAPLRDYMGVDKWFFRDANWSPDFPNASRDAIQLLRQEIAHSGQPPPEIHGVIGFTPTFASSILELTGPVTVQGETYTPENLAELLEFEVEFGFVERGVEFEQRKVIVGELTQIVIEQLFALPVEKWGDLFEIIKDNFRQKQIALYSQNEEVQSAFIDSDWAANIDPEGADDVLMVVDANMAALKTDPVVERTITYSIAQVDDHYQATVSIEYNHTGTFTLTTTRYRTFTRVYTPLGSELVDHSGTLFNDKLNNPQLLPGEVTVADDLGMTSFGGFISIEPGDTGTLTFTYRLPESVEKTIRKRLYQLKVFKQVGAANHALTLDLDFGKKVKTATPAEEPTNFGDNVYQLNTILDQDSVFTIQF